MCEPISSSRRGFLHQVGATGLIAAGYGAASAAEVDSHSSEIENPPLTALQALDRLLAGNARFIAGKTIHPHDSKPWRDRLQGVQHPFATILACSDSRVPPELLFDQGFGDLFTIRVAGNVISPDTLGSVQYAFAHLGTPLLMILGHSSCGAVTAAVDANRGHKDGGVWIGDLVDLIEPGIRDVENSGPREETISQAVTANVRWSMNQFNELPGFDELLDRHQDKRVVGAVYNLSSGQVELLP